MGVPPRVRYQHEQNKLRTKIKRVENRKQEKKIIMMNGIREELRKTSKKTLEHFDELVEMKNKINKELNDIILNFSKKPSKKSSKQPSKKPSKKASKIPSKKHTN